MTDFKTLLKLWNRPADLAADLGVKTKYISQMKWRDWVPPRHWPDLIASAEMHGIDGVTFEVLCKIQKSQKEKEPMA